MDVVNFYAIGRQTEVCLFAAGDDRPEVLKGGRCASKIWCIVRSTKIPVGFPTGFGNFVLCTQVLFSGESVGVGVLWPPHLADAAHPRVGVKKPYPL